MTISAEEAQTALADAEIKAVVVRWTVSGEITTSRHIGNYYVTCKEVDGCVTAAGRTAIATHHPVCPTVEQTKPYRVAIQNAIRATTARAYYQTSLGTAAV